MIDKIKNFLKNFGPGIIMASSAIGGSHIIASTQAGAYYGYQLALFIILVNLLKYPFYRIAFDYSTIHNKTLL
ncbi:MAG: divalent metal cation transporter, partial [Arcobacteraceae bacterium]